MWTLIGISGAAVFGLLLGCGLSARRREQAYAYHLTVYEEMDERLRHVLTTHKLWDEDGMYTFPDGTLIEKETV